MNARLGRVPNELSSESYSAFYVRRGSWVFRGSIAQLGIGVGCVLFSRALAVDGGEVPLAAIIHLLLWEGRMNQLL